MEIKKEKELLELFMEIKWIFNGVYSRDDLPKK